MEIEAWLLNEAGKSITAAEFSASLASWDTAAAQMAQIHETYDFYMTPATAFPAPKISELTHSKDKQEQFRNRKAAVSKDKQQELINEMSLPSLPYTHFTQFT